MCFERLLIFKHAIFNPFKLFKSILIKGELIINIIIIITTYLDWVTPRFSQDLLERLLGLWGTIAGSFYMGTIAGSFYMGTIAGSFYMGDHCGFILHGGPLRVHFTWGTIAGSFYNIWAIEKQ
jgi:hypothetical protein